MNTNNLPLDFAYTLETFPRNLFISVEYGTISIGNIFYLYENGIFTKCVVKNLKSNLDTLIAEDLNSGKLLELYATTHVYATKELNLKNELNSLINKTVKVWINGTFALTGTLLGKDHRYSIVGNDSSGIFTLSNVEFVSTYLPIPEIYVRLF